MTTAQSRSGSTIIPSMRYRNAPAAIEWLCRAFGFEKNAVYPDDAGNIMHAQLTFGSGMVMLGSVIDGPWAKNIAQPDEIGGRETQACSVTVVDVDAHYARAVAAGAEIIDPLSKKDYGGSGYGCRDLEGHLWWFGSYDPWTAHD